MTYTWLLLYEVKATSSSGESTMQRLRQEVMDVQADRGEYARIVDQFAIVWVPAGRCHM
jgi:cation transport ATPase